MMSKEAYEKLIRENVEWLNKQPDTLEREHIELILWESIKFYYPDCLEEKKVVQEIPKITYTETLRPKWRDRDDYLEYHDRDY